MFLINVYGSQILGSDRDKKTIKKGSKPIKKSLYKVKF